MSESVIDESILWDTPTPPYDEALERLPTEAEIASLEPGSNVTTPYETTATKPEQSASGETVAAPAEPEGVKLSRSERRRIRKTPEFKAAWKEAKRELKLDGREPKRLTKPGTWLNPDRWFAAEKTVATKAQTIAKMAVKFAFDSEARQEMLETEVTRRQMLGGILGTMGFAAATGTALAIRHQSKVLAGILEQTWPTNEPTFTFLRGETYKGQEQVGIFFPGFGDVHSKREARQWRANGHLDPNMPVGYLDYSNQSASPKELAELIKSSIDVSKVKSVVLFGRSMGGPMEFAVAAELGIPVKSMILCSSPFEISDGSYGNVGEMVAGLPSDKQLATEAKFGVNLWKAFRHNWRDVPGNIVDAWNQTVTGAAPWALQPEVKFLAGFDFYNKNLVGKLKNVLFPGWTEIVYVESDQPHTDKTVNDIAASMKYSVGLAKCFGIKLSIVGAPFDGHADVGVSSTKLKPWIQANSGPSPAPKNKQAAEAVGPFPGSLGSH